LGKYLTFSDNSKQKYYN